MFGLETFVYAWLWGQQTLPDADPAATSADPDDRIEVEIGGVRSHRGFVICALVRGEDGLPHPPEEAVARVAVRAVAGRVTCRFAGVAGGRYTVSAMHDESGDENDNLLVGSSPPPSACAPIGLAPDATGRLDPPDIGPACFDYAGGLHSLRIRLRY